MKLFLVTQLTTHMRKVAENETSRGRALGLMYQMPHGRSISTIQSAEESSLNQMSERTQRMRRPDSQIDNPLSLRDDTRNAS